MKYIALAALAVMMMAQPALANEKHMDAKAQAWFSKMDSNSDGKVTQSEHDAFGDNMFKEADTNSDNALTLDEMKAAKKKEKAEMKNDKE